MTAPYFNCSKGRHDYDPHSFCCRDCGFYLLKPKPNSKKNK
jgi:hypothetical protein